MLDDEPCDDIHQLFCVAPKSDDFRKLRKRLVLKVREADPDLWHDSVRRALVGESWFG